MGIPVGKIVAGKCYVTEIGRVRRLLQANDGKVKYDSRGRTAHGESWGAVTTVGERQVRP